MFRPGSVTMNEKDNLHRIRIQHMETKEIRYAGRVWWAHWLGMTKSKISFVLDSLYPCNENIFHTTGEFCKEAVGTSGPRGAKRYCRQCEQVLGLLGQAWNLLAMTDITTTIIEQALQEWTLPHAGTDWQELPVFPVHQCGPNCDRLGGSSADGFFPSDLP